MAEIFVVPGIFAWVCVVIACFSFANTIEQFFGYLMIAWVAKAILERFAFFQVLKIAFCFAFGMSFFVSTVLGALGMKDLMMALEWPTYILCFIAAILFCINPVGFMRGNFFKSRDGRRLTPRQWWQEYVEEGHELTEEDLMEEDWF